jgi:hypothetical protein
MINDSTVEYYNSKLNIDLSNLKNLKPEQTDKVRHYGSQAENLLKNKDLAMFIHHFKFEVTDALSSIRGHTTDDNAERVALSNQLVGIDSFVSSLKRAVYLKNRIGNTNEVPDTI